MTSIAVEYYQHEFEAEWNAFIAASSNGTFLCDRSYMEYHSDRFTDQSLIFRHEGKIVALFPANRVGTELVSHGGLTFAGIIVPRRANSALLVAIFDTLVAFAQTSGIVRIQYKAAPHVFHSSLMEEDLYVLHNLGARLVRRDLSTVVVPQTEVVLENRRRRMVAKSRRLPDSRIHDNEDLWEPYWELLTARLLERYQSHPTHSLNEIRLLQSRFPDRIKLLVASVNGTVHAGVVLYMFDRVVHAQYMATDSLSREHGLLDALLYQGMQVAAQTHKWFSFGISTEQLGTVLNAGLIEYKESFGGHGIVLDTYELKI